MNGSRIKNIVFLHFTILMKMVRADPPFHRKTFWACILKF